MREEEEREEKKELRMRDKNNRIQLKRKIFIKRQRRRWENPDRRNMEEKKLRVEARMGIKRKRSSEKINKKI
jgi:hypothetical protein